MATRRHGDTAGQAVAAVLALSMPRERSSAAVHSEPVAFLRIFHRMQSDAKAASEAAAEAAGVDGVDGIDGVEGGAGGEDGVEGGDMSEGGTMVFRSYMEAMAAAAKAAGGGRPGSGGGSGSVTHPVVALAAALAQLRADGIVTLVEATAFGGGGGGRYQMSGAGAAGGVDGPMYAVALAHTVDMQVRPI